MKHCCQILTMYCCPSRGATSSIPGLRGRRTESSEPRFPRGKSQIRCGAFMVGRPSPLPAKSVSQMQQDIQQDQPRPGHTQECSDAGWSSSRPLNTPLQPCKNHTDPGGYLVTLTVDAGLESSPGQINKPLAPGMWLRIRWVCSFQSSSARRMEEFTWGGHQCMHVVLPWSIQPSR